MQTEEMIGKPYEECLPLVRDSLKDRMKWVWTEDIDASYEAARKKMAGYNMFPKTLDS